MGVISNIISFMVGYITIGLFVSGIVFDKEVDEQHYPIIALVTALWPACAVLIILFILYNLIVKPIFKMGQWTGRNIVDPIFDKLSENEESED